MRKLPKLYDYKDEPETSEGNASMKRALKAIGAGFGLILLYALLSMDPTHNVKDYIAFFAAPAAILLMYGIPVFLINIFKLVWDALTS